MKLKLLLILLLSLHPLFSSTYFESNELMQRKGEIEALSGYSWELETKSGEDILYKDGIVHSSKRYHSDGYEMLRDGYRERVILNSSGLIERKLVEWEDRSEEYNYFYDDGVLSSYNLSVNGEMARMVEYLTAESGALVAFESNGMHYLSTDFFVFTSDGATVRVEDGNTEESVDLDCDIEALSDGGYIKRTAGYEARYSSLGRLMWENSDGVENSYHYNEDGTLSLRSTTDGSETVDEYFENGRAYRIVTKKDNDILSDKTYLESGEIEEIRYLEGKPSYKIIYDRDGKRVKEVVKL